jgi:hypothetical protein
MQMFDTNLWDQAENLKLLEVSMRLLRENNPAEYTFYINALVDARLRYRRLNFKETCAIIKRDQGLNLAKKIASLFVWLHLSQAQETTILEMTSLDQAKINEVLAAIFDEELIRTITNLLKE